MCCFSILAGIVHSSSGGAVWPALLTNLLGESNLSNTMGVMNFLCALGSLSGPPIAGWLVDRLGTYKYSFLLAGGLSFIASMLALIVWRASDRQTKKKTPDEVLLVVEMLTSL